MLRHVRGRIPLPVRRQWLLEVVNEVQARVPAPGGAFRRTSRLAELFPPRLPLERTILLGFEAELSLRSSPLRVAGHEPEGSPTTARFSREGYAVKARGILNERYQEPWSTRALAKEIACNRTALQVAFRQLTGITPHAYLAECRLRAAATLLRTTDEKLDAVAALAGISRATLCRAFQLAFGMTPARYRRLHRSDKI